MRKNITVKLTANFERNLEAIELFLDGIAAPQVYDRLLDELTDSVIPNLENFPAIGRSFLARSVRSVEAANALWRLKAKLSDGDLREYLFGDYLLLYAHFGDVIQLISIKHHRQLSFDFHSLWAIR